MFGLLNLDKPAGRTSRDVVNLVQRLVRPEKVGHAGTLDPLATGVLLVCIGPATRLVPHLHRASKTYVAEFLLSCESDSDDTELEVRSVPNAPLVTPEMIRGLLPRFTGTIEQVPPAHSAVKISGRRAYDLVRSGSRPDVKPRQVEIHRLELLSADPGKMTLQIECSSGTYVRALGRDLGRALGSGAVMSALRRTRIGPFEVANALDPELLTAESLAAAILPSRVAVSDLEQYSASPEEVTAIRLGRTIQPATSFPAGSEVAICDASGELIALADQRTDNSLAPRTVFSAIQ